MMEMPLFESMTCASSLNRVQMSDHSAKPEFQPVTVAEI